MRLRTLLLLLGCQALHACDSRSTTRLVLTGSSTVAPLATEMARRFEQLRPGFRVEVQAGGSSRGIADTRSGTAAIGMVSRALADSERDLSAFPIARDVITVITHRDNPVRQLTREQVRSIYTGTVRNWRELGGPDARIVVVHKAAGRATLDVFLEHFELAPASVRADIVIGDNEQGIKTVAGNPQAIGYVSLGAARHNAATGTSIRSIALADSGEQAMARPLQLLTNGPPTEPARAFIEFARSPAVHDLIRALAFAPIDP